MLPRIGCASRPSGISRVRKSNREELNRLRRENRELKQANEIGSCQWMNAPPRLGGCCNWALDSEGREGCFGGDFTNR